MIQGVLFDVDDTLTDTARAFQMGIRGLRQEYFPELPEELEPEMLSAWYADPGGFLEQYTRGEIDLLTQRIKRANELNQHYGGEPVTAENYPRWDEAFWGTYRKTMQAHDDAFPLLAMLKQKGIPMGVVTNAETSVQAQKLESVGIDPVEHFGNAFVGVNTLGFGKPNPEIFREACRQLGVAPENTIYIGDELTSDARAAANAGLVGVWLKRPYVHAAQAQRVAALEPNEDLTGIHRIESLNQVPELLNRLAAGQ